MDLSGRTLGDFVLREPIGEGGCAVVYRCEQPQLRRSAVVKVLHERGQRSDAALDRFRREAQLASQLDHPYAAHVYAFGDEDDGLFWIAMELVQGTALDDWLEAHGPMPLAQFVPFFECVADVVHAAHERGIVHRDLKPSNVMVIERNGRLFPKLLDFGIAKLTGELALPVPEHPAGTEAVTTAPLRTGRRRAQRTRTDPAAKDHRLTRTSAKLGSTAYMSPEQWTDPQAVGPASDLYSLGVLAYEVLTGRKPFTADSTHEYYHQHVYAEAPPLGDGFPPEVDRVIRRALAKAPEARHGNALELAAALRAALQLQPHEQLRSLAQVWDARARSPELLVKSKDLLRAPNAVVGQLERAFVTESRRHAARRARLRRALAAIAVALALGAVWYPSRLQTKLAEQDARAARQLTEATITQAELEQGRSALLHSEPDAQLHLGRAYQLGDRSPSTAFMLARALQPRLAEQAHLTSTSGRMWSAVFSPDGRQIATTDDHDAQIWNAETHQLLFPLPHEDTVYHAVYTPDGARLVTAAGDGSVRIWNTATGSLMHKLRLPGRAPRFYIAAVSRDGKLVAAVDLKGTIAAVWDAATGALMAEFGLDRSEWPSIAFSADGRWLAAGGGNDVRVVETTTWRRALMLPGLQIRAIAWDPIGPRLITGSAAGDAVIWTVPGGERLRHLRKSGEPVDAVAYSPDGKLVAAASRDGVEQVFDASSGHLTSQGNVLHDKVLSIEFDLASRLVVAASVTGVAAVSDAASGMPITMLDGPSQQLRVAHFDRSSRRIVGASWDGAARVWNASSPYRRWASAQVVDSCGLFGGVMPDGRFLAIGCVGHPTRIWDTAHNQVLAELPALAPPADDIPVPFPAVSAAGDRAAIARGNTAELYELPGGRLVRTIAHRAAITAVAFGPGSELVSGAVDGSVLLTLAGQEPIGLGSAPGGIDAIATLSDGQIAAADARGHVRILDRHGAVVAEMAAPARARMLRPSPDGRRVIAVPSYLGKAAPPVLLDVERDELVARLDGPQVYSARWVDGGAILTAHADGAARLWSADGVLQQTYRGGPRFLVDAALTPDRSMIVGGGGDGLLRFWDIQTGRPLWTMPAHKLHVTGIHFDAGDIVTRGFGGEISRWYLPEPSAVIGAGKISISKP